LYEIYADLKSLDKGPPISMLSLLLGMLKSSPGFDRQRKRAVMHPNRREQKRLQEVCQEHGPGK
jgi:hypothetical protein